MTNLIENMLTFLQEELNHKEREEENQSKVLLAKKERDVILNQIEKER